MQKPVITLQFQNGLNLKDFNREVFEIEGLNDHYDFVESDTPDFIIFGPYGNDVPKPGNYIRIGYYCENFTPDMDICEWAFGVPLETEVKHPRYKRIQWHGTNPQSLIKPADYNAEQILRGKTGFCNFLYSHKVPYREHFFKQLSKYKKVDAPGRSMNNMASIDDLYTGDIWQRKRQFLTTYKFTIAFENYVYPGYQTEKLYDAMQANSIPIYCGDPNIGNVFNTKSFVNSPDYINTKNTASVKWLEQKSQPDFIDIRPSFYKTLGHRLRRKLKSTGRGLKMKMQFNSANFNQLIERIIELDRDDNKYLEMLNEPWFKNNTPPNDASNKTRWEEIFNQKIL